MVEAMASDSTNGNGPSRLDRLEGLEEGLYKRVPIQLQPPHNARTVEGYIYLLGIEGRRDCGTAWSI